MVSSNAATSIASPRTRIRAALLLAIAVGVAVLANCVIAAAAVGMGASSAFAPLSVFVFGPFTLAGILSAYFGWRIVRARSRHAAVTLRVIVPVLTVLSFIPDTLLALRGFIPGTSTTAVVALALMHLVVVAVAVPVSARLAPVR